MTALQPARIEVARYFLARIARRVADAEIGYAPDDDAEWEYGADAAWLTSLRDHWRDRELCDFLFETYQHSSRKKLLEFMAESSDFEYLKILEQSDLAIVYCERWRARARPMRRRE